MCFGEKHRLVIVTHDLAIGGLQQVIVNICRSINKELFEVSVLCLRSRGEYADDIEEMGIKVITSQKEGQHANYLPFFRIAHILRQERADIIHTHNTQPFIDGTIGAILAGVRTIIHTDHARDFPDKKRYMFLEWLVSHFAYKVVGVSDHTSFNLMKYERIPSWKIMTIYNGIDGSKYSISINKTSLRKELNLPESGFIIGLGVRLAEQKGITYLLKAMPEVIKVFPNIILVIAGEGPLSNSLKCETKELGIERSVHFIGPRLDMPSIIKLFDLYVLPSLWEGLPMVLLEAMAAGCPIIATDVGGTSKAITNGYNGSLITPKDFGVLSKEIIKLLLSQDLRYKYITNGLERFKKDFSAEIMMRKYEKLYLRLP